jgi:2-haloalkanoic acid dehalogenase type II
MIQGVIFDLGNTLMYFEGAWDMVMSRGAQTMVEYMNARGYPLPEGFAQAYLEALKQGLAQREQDDLEYTAEQALTDTLAMHSVCYVPEGVIPFAVEKFFEPEGPHWRAYDDAQATLQTLRARGLKLALLSNATDHAAIERMARNQDLAHFFDPLLSSAKITHRKPDPRAFQPILDTWQIPANEIVMVGDAVHFDILGAHRAGMRGILIEGRWDVGVSPRHPSAEFADGDALKPDAVIKQLAELPHVIDLWNEKEKAHV